MWGNHIQRVKIVINGNIIEQVTDFKYLMYRISEYGSDLEDKLQTYNKTNGETLHKVWISVKITVVNTVNTKPQTVKENDVPSLISSFCNLTG